MSRDTNVGSMMSIILDGFMTAKKYRDMLKQELHSLSSMTKPMLLVILVGHDAASEIYVRNKVKACEEVGFESSVFHLPYTISQEDLLSCIQKANENSDVHAILVQLPLPPHLDTKEIIESISPHKDADGIHPYNLGRIVQENPLVTPCTPSGILKLLYAYNIQVSHKHVVIVGRSIIVGKTMSLLLMSNSSYGNATVTVCHSQTPDIALYTRQADILIVAIGKPRCITADMVKEGAIVIDVGISKTEVGLQGDCDFDAMLPKVHAITPVPKGIGPMTICQLLENTFLLWKKQTGR